MSYSSFEAEDKELIKNSDIGGRWLKSAGVYMNIKGVRKLPFEETS